MAVARLHATALFLEQLLAGSDTDSDEHGWVPWIPPNFGFGVLCPCFMYEPRDFLEDDHGYTRNLMDESGRLDPWRDVRAELFMAKQSRLQLTIWALIYAVCIPMFLGEIIWCSPLFECIAKGHT